MKPNRFRGWPFDNLQFEVKQMFCKVKVISEVKINPSTNLITELDSLQVKQIYTVIAQELLDCATCQALQIMLLADLLLWCISHLQLTLAINNLSRIDVFKMSINAFRCLQKSQDKSFKWVISYTLRTNSQLQCWYSSFWFIRYLHWFIRYLFLSRWNTDYMLSWEMQL